MGNVLKLRVAPLDFEVNELQGVSLLDFIYIYNNCNSVCIYNCLQ